MKNRSTVVAGLPELSVPRVARAVGIGDHFPRLIVEIYERDRLVRVEEFPDPREAFCTLYNEQQTRIADYFKKATKSATKETESRSAS